MFLGPAVEDGVLRFVSITQIEKWLNCNRQWAFRYVERLPEPSTEAQKGGIEFHARIDRYHKTGEKILTAMERPGLHLLYEPRDPLVPTEVERLGDVFLGGVPVYLKIDLLNLRDDYLDDEGRRLPKVGFAEVQDYKTTSDVEKRSKTPRGLLETTQMPVYGRWAMEKVGGEQVRLSHVYFGTARREAKKVTTLASWSEVHERWIEIDLVVREGMVPAAKAFRAVDLEPNWDACGRCPYSGICPKPANRVFTDLLGPRGEEIMQGFDPSAFLNQLTTGAPAPTPAPTAPAAAPAESETARQAAVQAEIARLQAQLAAPPSPNVVLTGQDAQAYAEATGAGAIPPGSAIITSASAASKAGVQPPDVPAPGTTGPTAKPVPPEVVPTLPPAVQAVLKANAPTAPVAPVSTPVAPAEPDKPKKTRAPRAPKSFAEAAPPTGIELYVDCVVAGIETAPLAPYVEALCDALCKQYKAVDVRCAPDDTPLAFGKWKGVVASMVRACPPPAGAYAIMIEGSEIRQVVAEALRPKCDVYVRGVR